MTAHQDPLKDPLTWTNDPNFTVVALLQSARNARTTVSTVKLAKTWDDANDELERMLDVVTETLGKPKLWLFDTNARTYTIDRGRGWAHVEFTDGITYHFSIQKVQWAKKEAVRT